MRDAKWLHEMGAAPSIMDYARFNYVAQPEDHIPPEDLVPRIGPYDVWATKWGYTPIAGAKTAEDEKPTLDKWSREQDKTPWLRFSSQHSMGSDPGEQPEAIGDADALKSTALGIRNLQRVAKMLIPATTAKEGEPYDDLSELYSQMLGQWVRELNHVANIVGGFDSREKHVGQEGVLFTPVSRARQEAAVKFLSENAFSTPTWAIDPAISRRIEPVGMISRVLNAQRSVLSNLTTSARFSRLVEQEAMDGSGAYSPADFLASVRKGIWKELDAPQVKVDAYRRNLQHAYLDLANDKVNGTPPAPPANLPAEMMVYLGGFGSSSDEKPMYRAELRALTASLATALAKTTDRETKAHLESARDQIARILDPKFAPVQSSAASGIRIPTTLESCWPDYKILPD